MDIGKPIGATLKNMLNPQLKESTSTITEKSISGNIWFFVFESYINWLSSSGTLSPSRI